MIIEEDVDLSKYTTFKMGGIAKKFLIPENIDDVINISKQQNMLDYIIGGGSNLLINDYREFENVVSLKKFNTKFENLGNGRYYIGSSIYLQELILKINNDGYGGIEYLFSVPGLVGGAIYMNAGRGKRYNSNISDYIESVEYLKDGKIYSFSKEDCKFSYRFSIFQDMKDIIILGANFKFEKTNKQELEKRRNDRINLCKKNQDMSKPNFGSVFRESNGNIMKVVRFFSKFNCKDKIYYSDKTLNWMLHGNRGTFKQAKNKINFVIKLHKLLGKKYDLEVKIWE